MDAILSHQTLLLEDSGRLHIPIDMRYIAFQHELSSQLPGSDFMVQEFFGWNTHTQENLKSNAKAIGLLGL